VGDRYPLTRGNLGAWQKAVQKVLPSFGRLLAETSKLPGAAVMYHTFDFKDPSDLEAKGVKLGRQNPRRHYVTPLDTNTPAQYRPPPGGYEKEYPLLSVSVLGRSQRSDPRPPTRCDHRLLDARAEHDHRDHVPKTTSIGNVVTRRCASGLTCVGPWRVDLV
jgi:hypothetical protein